LKLYPKFNRPAPWIYVSGPISLNTLDSTRVACELWRTLLRRGAVPICPHWSVLQHLIAPVNYEEYMNYDFALIDYCDALVWDRNAIPGDSAGSKREWDHAVKYEIPVFSNYEFALETFGL
jgi:hypothetical protein